MPPSTAASSAAVHSTRSARRRGPAERPAFEPLHPDRVAIAIPIQDLDPIPSPVGEDEQVARVSGSCSMSIASELGQAVVTRAQVAGAGRDEHPDGRGEADHRPGSIASIRRRSVSGSKPWPTTIRRPRAGGSRGDRGREFAIGLECRRGEIASVRGGPARACGRRRERGPSGRRAACERCAGRARACGRTRRASGRCAGSH